MVGLSGYSIMKFALMKFIERELIKHKLSYGLNRAILPTCIWITLSKSLQLELRFMAAVRGTSDSTLDTQKSNTPFALDCLVSSNSVVVTSYGFLSR